MELTKITEKIIGCAIGVHKIPSPGLLGSVYEKCLTYESTNAGLLEVGDIQPAFELSFDEVAQYGTAGFFNVVGPPEYNHAFGVQECGVNYG